MLIAGFLIASGLIFWYELARIRKYGGGRREVIAFSVGMALAVALGLAMILDLPVPNPIQAIEAVFRPLGERVVPPR
ncbi:hypothetical protein [Limnochorda pilosa]|uniref:Uncharacterized protein n=1 Tax=Limnochorda pilosa TaxID=1555112 RepID=A0A0K2SJY7_LIMPI|nr:hypothetical protein [Limnochorda pilosa]BAS27327.1 hypothetical protein LIP_1478 [Limnochorda pilosa]